MRTQLNGEVVAYGTGSGHAEPGAPSIVFIHGAGFDHSVWVMPARYFARHGFQVLALYLPAHGKNTPQSVLSITEKSLNLSSNLISIGYQLRLSSCG